MATQVRVVAVGSTNMATVDASTVREAIASYDSDMSSNTYTVKVNNQESTMDADLNDGDFVTIGEKVKGGTL